MPDRGTDDTLLPTAAASGAAEPAPVRPPAGHPAADYVDLPAIDPRHYVVGDELARGGMGRILTARDRRLGRPVAIKELLHDHGDARMRFEREARITARLQHPGIVNILEAGAWPSGEPFYVMKLVAGESLDKVIARAATLAARLGLLPNVIAAVDALAYAHARGVIHRDLKPANVLVGEFGETVVIDWGLAKDLAAPEDAVALGPIRTRAAAGPLETAVGAVMGTPAYMPAEQAVGEAVDARADVYALGAMLYHALAGVPPYTGNTTDEILVNVIKGPPVPLEQRAPGVPADLVTIVGKAMAHDPAGRYPSAKELAADLKQFQTGQLVGAHQYSAWQLIRRWIRRHRTAVAVASIAVVLLAALAVLSVRGILEEQARTEAQRRAAVVQQLAAEQSQREAEDLMNFMMVDLRDKLVPLGKLPLLDPMVRKATTYYAQRGEVGTAEDQHKRSTAHLNIGDVLLAQGNLPGALVEYRAAAATRARLAAAAPARLAWQRDLAFAHDRVGDVLLAQHATAEAVAAYRASLAIAETVDAAAPSDLHRRDLSVGYNKIGDALVAMGNHGAAVDEYAKALAIRVALAAADPDNGGRQRDLSASYDRIGAVLAARGELDRALEKFRASLAIAERLAARPDATSAAQRDLSTSHDRIGDILVDRKDLTGALQAYLASLAIRLRLVQGDPTNAGWQRDLSVSYDALGDVLLDSDAKSALDMYRRSLAISTTLAALDPTNVGWQRDLAFGHVNVGDALVAMRDPVGARVAYRASLAVREALAHRDPANPVWQRELAGLRAKLARLSK